MNFQVLDPQNVVAFQRLLGNAALKEVVIHFLNALLERSETEAFNEISWLKTTSVKNLPPAKNLVTLVATTGDEKRYLVEIHLAKDETFSKNIPHYALQSYQSTRTPDSLAQPKLAGVIMLVITNAIIFPHKPAYKVKQVLLEGAPKNLGHLPNFSFIFLELGKFKAELASLTTATSRWAYLLKAGKDLNSELACQAAAGGEKALEKAYQQLWSHNWTSEELKAYGA